MKKYLLLFIIIFSLTGCDINYNMIIDENLINEDIKVTDNLSSLSENNKKLFNEFIEKPIPLRIDSPVLSEGNEKIKGTEYYKTTNLTNDSQIGMKYSSSKLSIENASMSTLITYAYGKFDINQMENTLLISTNPNCKLFEQYSNLDKITVNITAKDYTLKQIKDDKTGKITPQTNADKIDGETYTWYITKSNYKSKSIYVQFEKKEIEKSKTILDLNVFFSIILIAIILISIFVGIYILMKRKAKKNNEI